VVLVQPVPTGAIEPARPVADPGSEPRPAIYDAPMAQPGCADHRRVVVIGAGMAGLGAARRLTEAGCPVLVVEARPRLGGRLHTVDVLGATVDLGAAWIHGPEGNPVADLAEQAGVTGHATAFYRDPARLLVAGPDGPLTDRAAFSRGLGRFWAALERAVNGGDPPDGGLSVAAAVERGVIGDGGLSVDEATGFRHGARVTIQNLEAEDAEHLCLAELGLDERPGGDRLLVGGGYGRIVGHLAEGLEVRTSWPVETVAVEPDGVSVRGPAGALGASAVIVTVPLPLLVDGLRFEPALPSGVVDALGRLGMGCAEKLVLGFAERVWPHGLDSIALVDLPDDHPTPAWTAHPSEPILVSYGGGRRARRFATLDDDALVSAALDALRRALPRLASPTTVTRTGWTTDPWSRGAYSYNALPGARAARQRLGEPIHGRLFLAGEATSAGAYGTSHGAFASGLRAAEQALRLTA
jgi:polyamine oxidase